MRHHMRRADRQITDPATVERILRDGRYTSLALADSDQPYVVTLSYGYDSARRRLYFHAAHEGRKLAIIERNPRACATVVADGGYSVGDCAHPFESVVLFGTMRVVTDPAEKVHAIRTLVEHLEPDPETFWKTRSWTLERRIGEFRALCLDVAEMTAKAGR